MRSHPRREVPVPLESEVHQKLAEGGEAKTARCGQVPDLGICDEEHMGWFFVMLERVTGSVGIVHHTAKKRTLTVGRAVSGQGQDHRAT